jgi:serine/threonine protein kinase
LRAHEAKNNMKAWLRQIFGRQDKSAPPPVEPAPVQARQSDPKKIDPIRPDVGYVAEEREPHSVADDWIPGQVLLNDFVVGRTLGEGGMGKVYLVSSRSTGSQFAVKRAKGLRDADRRSFLAELQTWIDLPQHANLVSCRFFRTSGDALLIFAEYVEGGSLKDWIDRKRLYEGGQRQALERMLNVAIQFAWALHCVHELGLIHQDVKPGNVLMNANRNAGMQGVTPMVTDYGLARANAAGGESHLVDPCRNIFFSCAGGTPAYWSPEQAKGRPLTRKTDIWSWGLSVMEMFTGEVNWMAGQGAAQVLEQYLQQDEYVRNIPAMPSGVAGLLKMCFHPDPVERLPTLAEAVEQLKAIYRESIGTCYSGALYPIERTALSQAEITERRGQRSASWANLQMWLEKGLRASGRDPAEAVKLASRLGATGLGELVAALAVYDEAKLLYEQLIRDGRSELESDLASICHDKALVHSLAADYHGALRESDQATAILARLVNQEGRDDLANNLANAYMNKATIVSELGNLREAVALYDEAIALRESLVNDQGHRELARDLAVAYLNKAVTVKDLGDPQTATALYDQVIPILERLVNQEGRRDMANELAMAYMNKATTIGDLGSPRVAAPLHDKAIAILERLVNQEGRRDLANDLASAYMNKANAVIGSGNYQIGVSLYDQVIAIRERLVNQEGRGEFSNDLAKACVNKGGALRILGDPQTAKSLHDQAIAILERLVNQEGRRDLANDLATAYMNKANAVTDLGEVQAAVAFSDQAIAILERLVKQEGHGELANDLAGAYMAKANKLMGLGGMALS